MNERTLSCSNTIFIYCSGNCADILLQFLLNLHDSAQFKEGNLKSNCFQSARLGWNTTESTSIRKKIRTEINKEDEEKNLLLTERNPARPKRSLGQSSETEMKHAQDLEVWKTKVSEK